MLDTGVNVIQASDVAGGIITSTGAVATRQVTHGNIFTTAHNNIPSNGGEVVLLRDEGFKWTIGGAPGTRTLGTKTPGEGNRDNNLATTNNLNRGFSYDASALWGGIPGVRSSCGLGREGPDSVSGIQLQLSGDGDVIGFRGWRWPERARRRRPQRDWWCKCQRQPSHWNVTAELVSSRA
ncbi:hypothetical protein GUJ93_ZPchr0012g18998 [Zizania palustris]|uniref:Uncharacterized protein n=1 Tax=Zizania palustris TaxID=103762 RepID=A0A8J6BWE6_ZIZPA|nr:hypothetical protein GUJ93_ZPchr0012g18998 [Zizania palustris]